MGLGAGKVMLGQVFLLLVWFLHVSVIWPELHTHLCITRTAQS